GCEALKQLARPRMYGFHDFPGLRATPHIRLICSHDQQVPGSFQSFAPFNHARQEDEMLKPLRWVWFSVSDNRCVDDPITVQEDSAPQFGIHFTLSHLV